MPCSLVYIYIQNKIDQVCIHKRTGQPRENHLVWTRTQEIEDERFHTVCAFICTFFLFSLFLYIFFSIALSYSFLFQSFLLLFFSSTSDNEGSSKVEQKVTRNDTNVSQTNTPCLFESFIFFIIFFFILLVLVFFFTPLNDLPHIYIYIYTNKNVIRRRHTRGNPCDNEPKYHVKYFPFNFQHIILIFSLLSI